MKKPWSISTTVRNPDRVIHFLSTLKKLEGKVFDDDVQVKFQTMLIQDKHYKPTRLTTEQLDYFETNNPMEYDVAKEIFEAQNYHDPPMRGRQSFAVLQKMALCMKNKQNFIRITEFGNALLLKDNDIGDLFFNFFLKWQLPNPVEQSFRASDGFGIFPFLGTLHLIRRVNQLWAAENKKPVGVSKEEFSLFVPTLLNHDEIDIQAARVIEYRKSRSDDDKKAYATKFLKEFLGNGDQGRIDGLRQNLKDYGDNTIRYFRLTRYIRIRGSGYYVDLEPYREVEISALLDKYNAAPTKFRDDIEYVEYVANRHKPDLPWKTQQALEQIHQMLSHEINEITDTLRRLDIQIPEINDHGGLSLDEQNDSLKAHLVELQNILTYNDMSSDENISKCIDTLTRIYDQDNRPLELERQAARSMMALNDALKIQPNYPLGDDGEPTHTAPGGKPDLECYYDQFNAVCEVTMMRGRDQWVNEGQPVMRHFRDFEDDNSKKVAYCLFIAPEIHRDTLNTFWTSIKHAYEGKQQKIIPISIDLFVSLLEIQREHIQQNGRGLPHSELMNLYDSIMKSAENTNDSREWFDQISKNIYEWRQCLLVKA